MFRHITVTVLVVVMTVVLSMATDCVGIVLELNVSRPIYSLSWCIRYTYGRLSSCPDAFL